MKILIVCQYYFPEQFLINQIAPELVRREHEVTVLTGLPNYPSGVVPEEYRHGQHRHEVVDGVEVIRCYEKGRKGGPHNLLLNYLTFRHSALKTVRKLPTDYDVVMCYQLSPITMLAPAVAYKKRTGAKLLCYCLDLWPESAQAYLPKGNIIYKYIARYSRKLYQACDRIAVTSKPFINYLHCENGVPIERMCYIPQHADGSMLSMDMTAENNGIADFMFAGNLGKGQKIETIVKAAAKLNGRKDYVVHMVGDGTMRKTLEQIAAELGVKDRFIFHGNQKRDDMPKFYSMADALLITLRGNNAVGATMPGKLQMYMTTSKPILGAINGAARQVIEESRCGRSVMAEDSDGLAALMLDFIEHPDKYKNCGENARSYFKEHFTFDVYMNRLEKEIKNLLE